ncbi:hypothetical protein CH263_25690 [Rhodococcus sp. 06-1059B-a]|nr:hypothetical protein [Rhodococcus sp. 06-1059B-a]OZD57586.1 hypothetical protein CH263_25690 [Rhodococcus sp. 06-1059B-a]
MSTSELARQRDRAYATLFESFTIERQLDFDDETWSNAERAEFNRQAGELIAHWNARIDAAAINAEKAGK